MCLCASLGVYLLLTSMWPVPTVQGVCGTLFPSISCGTAVMWAVLLFNWLGSVSAMLCYRQRCPVLWGEMSSLRRQALHQGLRALAVCFNILTQLSQLMNTIRDPWASTYKPMDKHTHMHQRKLFLLFPAHTTSVCSRSWLKFLPFLSKLPVIPCVFLP